MEEQTFPATLPQITPKHSDIPSNSNVHFGAGTRAKDDISVQLVVREELSVEPADATTVPHSILHRHLPGFTLMMLSGIEVASFSLMDSLSPGGETNTCPQP